MTEPFRVPLDLWGGAGVLDFCAARAILFLMNLTISAVNDAVDDQGGRTQGFDVVDGFGRMGWLIPAVRNRLEHERLDLRAGDVVVAEDFVLGGDHFPLLVAECIQKVGAR
jgi:hypothetical protein